MSTPQTPDSIPPQPDPTAPASRELVLENVVAAPAPIPMQEVARPRRRALPWILAGVVVALLLAAAVVVWFVVLPLVNGPARGPQDAVVAYDQAYDDADCALYQSITTTDFQEALAPTCADFESVAQTFLDSYTDYDVEVTATEISGDTATVTTTETWVLDGETSSQEYVYTLLLQDGSWRIDDLR